MLNSQYQFLYCRIHSFIIVEQIQHLFHLVSILGGQLDVVLGNHFDLCRDEGIAALAKGISNSNFFGNEIKMAYFQISAGSELIGKTILSSQFRTMYNCNIVETIHEDKIDYLPHSNHILLENSSILVVGTYDQMRILNAAIKNKKLGLIPLDKPMTLAEFTRKNEENKNHLYTYSLIVNKDNGYIGTTLRNNNIRKKLQAEVIGLVRGHYTICNINPDLTFDEGDLLWLLGRQDMLKSLYRENLY
mgnify:CR=1 FL=1